MGILEERRNLMLNNFTKFRAQTLANLALLSTRSADKGPQYDDDELYYNALDSLMTLILVGYYYALADTKEYNIAAKGKTIAEVKDMFYDLVDKGVLELEVPEYVEYCLEEYLDGKRTKDLEDYPTIETLQRGFGDVLIFIDTVDKYFGFEGVLKDE